MTSRSPSLPVVFTTPRATVPQTRRTFLRHTALGAAALGLSARVRAAAPGANGDVRVAVIGFNSRGEDHLKHYEELKSAGVRLTALCDVDANVLAKGVDRLSKKGYAVTPYTDLRKLLESKEVDAVSIATPNHWHSLAAIWALQAGKDVYVEKPISHEIWEGRQLVNAAKQTGRVVQMGVQSRSGYGIAQALEWAKAGHLGAVKYVRGLCYKRRASIGKAAAPLVIPPEIDFDLWCGPAAKLPIQREKLHYDWHWVWNTGNGDLGNQGIHQMDIARRFLGEPGLAPRVFSIGARVGYVDDGETPNSMFIFQDYEKAPLIFEVRGLPAAKDAREMDKYRGASVGVIVQYEHGHILVPDYNNATAYDADGQELQQFRAPKKGEPGAEEVNENHYANFIEAVQQRKPEMTHGQILEGHISSALCHTGNISVRLGKKESPDELREVIKGNPEALDSLNRLLTHLEANQVDANIERLAMGQFLKLDPEKEKFIGNAEADALLKREARAPFIIPEIAV